MNLFILRHAEAVQQAASDAERALTEKGVKQAKTVGRFCAEQGIKPDVILASPLVRARDTALLVACGLEAKNRVQIDDALRPGMDMARGLEVLQARGDCDNVMIVGHEPDLSAFCAGLLGAKAETVHLRKAGLAKLSLPELTAGAATLEFLLPVKFL
jgi:phosphohistidine phosphatase